MSRFSAAGAPVVRFLPLRFAWREVRGGVRGFYVFIACIALGVMAIAGVSSVAASLSGGLTREGRTILGGDVAFSLIQREASPEELLFLESRGRVSSIATMRAMVRAADGQLALVEVKASTTPIRCSGKSCSIRRSLLQTHSRSATAHSVRRQIPPC